MYDRDDDMYDQMQAEGRDAQMSEKHRWDEELAAEARGQAQKHAEAQAEYDAEIAAQESEAAFDAMFADSLEVLARL